MDDYCIICEHPTGEHYSSGCHKTSLLKGSCDCVFVQRPALPSSASAAQYRERADWWKDQVRITDDHIRRAGNGSARRQRLERFRDNAHRAASHAQEMAELTDAAESRQRSERKAAETKAAPAADSPVAETQRGGSLEGITIAAIRGRPLHQLELMQERFDASSEDDQALVKARVEAEFDGLEPSRKRELLEDDESRDFLEHIGVVSRWTVGTMRPLSRTRPEPSADAHREVGTAEWADEIVRVASDPAFGDAFDEATRKADAHMRFVQALDEEYGDTIGDVYWAQTGAEEGRLPRDEAFIVEYQRTRARVEAYWHNWTLAPSPQLQRAFMANDPEGFKRNMTLAIQVLTPTEKSCFKSHDELFGWIASGMKPLILEGERVPLEQLLEPRYLAMAEV